VFAESVEKELKSREREFCSYSEISAFIATWNVGGFLPGPIFDISKLLDIEGNSSPDLLVLGFQELVDLNAKNVLVSSNVDTVTAWQTILVSNLKKLDRYNLIRVKDLVGIVLFVFAKDSIKDRISRIEYDTVKTGLAGTLGNKGAVVIKLCVDDSTFVFANCHLEDDVQYNSYRLSNVTEIHQRAFQQEGVGKRKVIY
jgi:hypothetical protein